MPYRTPNEVRWSIIRMYQMGHTQTYTAAALGVCERTVRNVITLWSETGDVRSVSTLTIGRPRLLDYDVIWYIQEKIHGRPDFYLDEMKADLMVSCGIEVSVTTIWRAMKRCGITRKKLDRRAMERSEEARAQYRLIVSTLRPGMIIFVDESSFDVRATYRGMGYALSGERAFRRAFFVRGDRYSLLPAISLGGICALDVVKGSFTAESFKSFIEKLLNSMNPYPADNSVIVMDNCRIHKSAEITDMITARGMHYIFLPAYSPDFNPIELAFSKIKTSIRRDGEIARLEMTDREDPQAEANIEAMFHRHVYSVTAQDAHGWFEKCGYIS